MAKGVERWSGLANPCILRFARQRRTRTSVESYFLGGTWQTNNSPRASRSIS